ncbi:MAG: peroxidase family protein [Pseudomonadota bacterium]
MKTQISVIVLIAALASCSDSDSTNTAPVVEIGATITATEGDQVQVSASVVDAEGDAALTWTQISGPTVELTSSNTASTSFRAPNVRDEQDVILRLTADDGSNAPVSDTVTVTIADTERNSRSPQGIDDDGDDRRDGARGNRRNDPLIIGTVGEVRSYDGSFNNVDNPLWGTTFAHLQRLAAADYADGISSLAGDTRPSARVVSNQVVNQDIGVSEPNTFGGTDFVWQWGQWIDHDLDLTDGAEESEDILVPEGDVFFDTAGTGSVVIPFNRALFDQSTGTDASNPREQENEITSWIDGSMVYGSDADRAEALKDDTTPYLLATSAGNLLPFNTDLLTNADAVGAGAALFLAGDVRVNEQIGLTVMHTLFVREHNRMAEIINTNNPDLTDEEVFEVTRRLLIGKLQYITYNDWLPALIGNGAIPDYTGYDASINPTIFNEFSVGAFRLGHSMLNEQLQRFDENGDEIAAGHLNLMDGFFAGHLLLLEEDDIDPFLRGFATQEHQELDNQVVSDIRNFLFGQPGAGGLDLASLNIQRGRDHGVPSYNDMREAMGLTRYTLFSQITSDQDVADALFDTYGDINDIDLWVGGLSEDNVAGSQLGELFQTIIVKQFTEIRDGDRFWYENDLSDDEIDLVEATSLADIIIDNTDIDDSELQGNVFEAR